MTAFWLEPGLRWAPGGVRSSLGESGQAFRAADVGVSARGNGVNAGSGIPWFAGVGFACPASEDRGFSFKKGFTKVMMARIVVMMVAIEDTITNQPLNPSLWAPLLIASPPC